MIDPLTNVGFDVAARRISDVIACLAEARDHADLAGFVERRRADGCSWLRPECRDHRSLENYLGHAELIRKAMHHVLASAAGFELSADELCVACANITNTHVGDVDLHVSTAAGIHFLYEVSTSDASSHANRKEKRQNEESNLRMKAVELRRRKQRMELIHMYRWNLPTERFMSVEHALEISPREVH